jgi:hypothetical protein
MLKCKLSYLRKRSSQLLLAEKFPISSWDAVSLAFFCKSEPLTGMFFPRKHWRNSWHFIVTFVMWEVSQWEISALLWHVSLCCLHVTEAWFLVCCRMQGKRHVTQAWYRQPATWNPSGGYRCAHGGHSGATLPRSMPCTGVQTRGKQEERSDS